MRPFGDCLPQSEFRNATAAVRCPGLRRGSGAGGEAPYYRGAGPQPARPPGWPHRVGPSRGRGFGTPGASARQFWKRRSVGVLRFGGVAAEGPSLSLSCRSATPVCLHFRIRRKTEVQPVAEAPGGALAPPEFAATSSFLCRNRGSPGALWRPQFPCPYSGRNAPQPPLRRTTTAPWCGHDAVKSSLAVRGSCCAGSCCAPALSTRPLGRDAITPIAVAEPSESPQSRLRPSAARPRGPGVLPLSQQCGSSARPRRRPREGEAYVPTGGVGRHSAAFNTLWTSLIQTVRWARRGGQPRRRARHLSMPDDRALWLAMLASTGSALGGGVREGRFHRA